MSHFQVASEEEIDLLLQNKKSKRTKYIDKTNEKRLKEFINHLNIKKELKELTTSELNVILKKFWPSLRQKMGLELKAGSLQTIKYSLARILKSHLGEAFSMTSDPQLCESNSVFEAYLKSLKEKGFGAIKHHRKIEDEDFKKILPNLSENNPVELQLKVWFLIQIYFCRRGLENSYKLKKSNFIFENIQGKDVLRMRDEFDKNHSAKDREEFGGRIYETGEEDSHFKTIKLYLERLNPKNDFIWQKPAINFIGKSSWYENKNIGENTISKFMKKISSHCNLSIQYTNHCVRVTSVSTLCKIHSENEVKNISGHKSLSALGIYKRLEEGKYEEMAGTIKNSLQPSTSKENQSDELTTFELHNLDSTDLYFLLSDEIEFDCAVLSNKQELTESNKPIFNNCTFSNVNFYFNR